MEQQRIEVEIFGANYAIKSDENPTYTAELAQFVDDKMRNITHKSNIVSTGKVAVLAAIHIADDLFKTKKTVEYKLERLMHKIDSKLKQISVK